ncbi:MAG: hypothetical protein RBS43_01530 [Candidatus Cloacimonas sp.]|jgi:hypothetical protein|nr:hypothetical protein [Candidatus Cloacimonas sp.]
MSNKILHNYSAELNDTHQGNLIPKSEPVQMDDELLVNVSALPKKVSQTLRIAHRIRNFRPIILSLILLIGTARTFLNAQITGSVDIGARYSDNVFQLSEHDYSRFDDNHNRLDFAETTDDVTMATRIELAYPLHYRWWKVTPSVIGSISQNVSNTDKYKRDAAFKLRVDRYYWSFTAQYAYNPYIYFRHFVDTDGTGVNEKYSYSRNTYRVDLALRPTRNATVKANVRSEDYCYNEYFTEADGQAVTVGCAASYRFPTFTLEAGYDYRDFSNENLVDQEDASYASNIYKGKITMPKMPLSDKGSTKWQPSLGLNYEQRFYQGGGSWYGGRADYTYTISSGFSLLFSPQLNLSLDYSHIFRNVLSDNVAVLTAKEYSENRLAATLKYKF